MKHFITILLALLFAVSAQAKVAESHPKSVVVTPTPSIPVPTYFTAGRSGLTVNGRVLSGLNQNYAHLGILNESKYPISVGFSTDGGSTGISESEKLYVASSGAGVWDDISVFQWLYLMSEEGGSIMDGKIKIMVW